VLLGTEKRNETGVYLACKRNGFLLLQFKQIRGKPRKELLFAQPTDVLNSAAINVGLESSGGS
jgi:hypothetical protein